MKSTQADKILQSLKDAGEVGVHPKHFIEDLHIYLYTARLRDIRVAIGCSCRHNHRCANKEHIINKDLHDGTHKYYYVNDKTGLDERLKEYEREYHNRADDTLF